MGKTKHLIIGCGSAALSALEKIRSITSDGEVKLVTMENSRPYSPTALPYLLSGRIEGANLWMKEEEYFTRMGATVVRGKEVTQVLPEDKVVIYRDGDREQYDKLLIASGSAPIKSQVKGMEAVSFGGFHTIEDYKRLLPELRTKRDIAIYGGGLVAMEIAEALLERGCRVKPIVRSRILRRYFDVNAGTIIQNIFLKAGAQIFTGSEAQEIKKNIDRIEIYLADGRSLDTDILITALGVVVKTSFLNGTNIKMNKGILVDNRMKTSVDDIYAAGDVTEAPDFFTGEPLMNPILPSAVEQGKIAGANMAGEDIECEGDISMNVFNFFSNRAISIGLPMPEGSDFQVMQEEDSQRNYFKKLVFKNGRLVGVTLINVDVEPGLLLYLIRKRVEMDSHKDMLFEKPKDASRWLMLQSEKRQTITA